MLERMSEATTICIIGQKGSGKTYASALIANELIMAGKKVFVFDTVGVYSEKKLIVDAAYSFNTI